ncbi:hypothetical protein GCM10027517_20940 [Phycicoccus ginsengisoli]
MAPRKATKISSPDGPFEFTFDDFNDWYSKVTASLLEPARATFTRILNETLDQELSDVDRLRIRVSHSRIKNPTRLWNKMLAPKYSDQITTLDDIAAAVDDLVGVRVTCNNLVDVETFRNIIIGLEPVDATELPTGLCIDPDSERRHSKPSGYRAYHINLHTLIPARHEWRPARGELQVRTLLQDSWGELTHEDTYKPGSSMPVLVTQLAKRMADLLATVDDLAQDLRNELDELALKDVEEPTEAAGEHDPTPAATVLVKDRSNVREALLAETQRVVAELTRPASLAQVAWQVQANFGREVTATWGGFGSFKELLKTAAPDVQVIDVPPGTVIPANVSRSMAYADNPDGTAAIGTPPEGVPPLLHRLRQSDSRVPAVTSEKLSKILKAVETALEPGVWATIQLSEPIVGVSDLNKLTRYARDSSAGGDFAPSRVSLDYLFKSLYFSQHIQPGLSKREIADAFGEWLFGRASRLGLVLDEAAERAALSEWLEAALHD